MSFAISIIPHPETFMHTHTSTTTTSHKNHSLDQQLHQSMRQERCLHGRYNNMEKFFFSTACIGKVENTISKLFWQTQKQLHKIRHVRKVIINSDFQTSPEFKKALGKLYYQTKEQLEKTYHAWVDVVEGNYVSPLELIEIMNGLAHQLQDQLDRLDDATAALSTNRHKTSPGLVNALARLRGQFTKQLIKLGRTLMVMADDPRAQSQLPKRLRLAIDTRLFEDSSNLDREECPIPSSRRAGRGPLGRLDVNPRLFRAHNPSRDRRCVFSPRHAGRATRGSSGRRNINSEAYNPNQERCHVSSARRTGRESSGRRDSNPRLVFMPCKEDEFLTPVENVLATLLKDLLAFDVAVPESG